MSEVLIDQTHARVIIERVRQDLFHLHPSIGLAYRGEPYFKATVDSMVHLLVNQMEGLLLAARVRTDGHAAAVQALERDLAPPTVKIECSDPQHCALKGWPR